MPVYQYRCEDCCTEFELKHGFSDEALTSCPKCKGKLRRLFSPTAIIFKGSGFYITDSRKDSPKTEETGS